LGGIKKCTFGSAGVRRKHGRISGEDDSLTRLMKHILAPPKPMAKEPVEFHTLERGRRLCGGDPKCRGSEKYHGVMDQS